MPSVASLCRTAVGAFVTLGIVVTSSDTRANSQSLVQKFQELFKDAPAPETVISSYLEAQKSGDFARAYDFLSTADRAYRSKEEYQSEESKGYAFAGALAKTLTFKIKNVEVHDLKATVTIEVTHPNLFAILGPMMAAALSGTKNDAQERAQKALTDKLASGDFPTQTTDDTETLIREADAWRVYKGLEVKSRATRMLEEGKRLAHEKQYESAENKFARVAEIPGDLVKEQRDEASKQLAETSAKAELDQQKTAYMKQVKLYNLKTGRYDTYLEKSVPGVSFKIKNEGDLTLSEVQVTVYFKDASGATIHEETFYPIRASSFGLDTNHGPLKPGYIWQIESGRFYTAKDVPSEWKVGAAEAKITDIDFAH